MRRAHYHRARCRGYHVGPDWNAGGGTSGCRFRSGFRAIDRGRDGSHSDGNYCPHPDSDAHPGGRCHAHRNPSTPDRTGEDIRSIDTFRGRSHCDVNP